MEIHEAQARVKAQGDDARLKSKRLEKVGSTSPVKHSTVGKQLLLAPAPKAQEESITKAEKRTIGRGDVDEAIRSMRRGTMRKTRDRDHRPVSKIYFDGN